MRFKLETKIIQIRLQLSRWRDIIIRRLLRKQTRTAINQRTVQVVFSRNGLELRPVKPVRRQSSLLWSPAYFCNTEAVREQRTAGGRKALSALKMVGFKLAKILI